jgi:2-methylaconitate cis-trans-isomerase PrpF
MAHLKLASAEFVPDAGLVAAAEEILARVKSGEIVGLFAVAECGQISREVYGGGELDVDGIAGFAARVLAAMADRA